MLDEANKCQVETRVTTFCLSQEHQSSEYSPLSLALPPSRNKTSTVVPCLVPLTAHSWKSSHLREINSSM
ncbi:hypothetical protein E2C01_020223 [Portunus trituberculatus]|uniref:Uncharacterized protein n=1 Tax=Portunus trituberculatus TaxID=210409 RepID=A0A5B7DZY4_PORTR|nr:hypothetical protein [Portunus trituberculatus]